MASDLHDKMSRHETSSLVSQQIKPIVQAMSSMEKAIQLQEHHSIKQQGQWEDIYQKTNHQYQEWKVVQQHTPPPMTTERVHQIVDDIIHERHLGEINKLSLESTLSHHTEYVLKQVNILGESIRLEVVSSNREEMAIAKQQWQSIIDETVGSTREVT